MLDCGIAPQYCASVFTKVMQAWEDKTAVRARRGKKLATRVTVSVDERDYEQLSTLAEEYRVSLAWLVRYAVGAIEELEATAKLYLLLQGHATRPLDGAAIAELEARFPRR